MKIESGLQCGKLGCPECIHYRQWLEMTQPVIIEKKECPSCFDPSGAGRCGCEKPKVDEVSLETQLEEKMKQMVEWYPNFVQEEVRKGLCELVALARKS